MNDSELVRTLRWPGDPATLTVEAVDFEAVAHVLANTCCWGGRSRRFYSLAQHAVTVSAAAERLGGMNEKDQRLLSLHGLLADAWRAWFRDDAVAGRSGQGTDRARRDAAAVQRTVLEAAGVDPELPGSWTQALGLTQRMAEAAVCRDLSDAGIEFGTRDSGPLFPPLKERVRPLAPDRAARRWLERFEALRALGSVQAPGRVQSPDGVQAQPAAAPGGANDGSDG